MSTVALPRVNARAESVAAGVPWFIWCAAASVTSVMIGAHWDISWHSSIGRDTFWTPAHLAIYLCGVLSGISCGYLILNATFSKHSPFRDASVQILGLRGPLGAFISSWGGIAMLTSAPFDNWWHDTYGLDVKILSPPHTLLMLGTLAVEVGTLLLVLGFLNRSEGRLREHLRTLFLYVGGMILVLLLILTMEYVNRNQMHDSLMYRVVSATIPVVLAAVSRGSGDRWAGVKAAGFYSVMLLGLLWVLPLFPAEPKLGPVFHPVTHFAPVAGFPLLLIVPAFFLDLLWPKISGWNRWMQAAVAGAVFVAAFLAAQWPFADFLMSPFARNWVFGSNDFGYYLPPTSDLARYRFTLNDSGPVEFAKHIGWGVLFAILSVRTGLMLGDWMRSVKR